jgi:hypothetical protein
MRYGTTVNKPTLFECKISEKHEANSIAKGRGFSAHFVGARKAHRPDGRKSPAQKKFNTELTIQNFPKNHNPTPPLTSSHNGKGRRIKGSEGKEA